MLGTATAAVSSASAARVREQRGRYRSPVFPRQHQPALQQLGEGPGKGQIEACRVCFVLHSASKSNDAALLLLLFGYGQLLHNDGDVHRMYCGVNS